MRKIAPWLLSLSGLLAYPAAAEDCTALHQENQRLLEEVKLLQTQMPQLQQDNQAMQARQEELLKELTDTRRLVTDLQQRLEQLLKLQAGLLQQLERHYQENAATQKQP